MGITLKNQPVDKNKALQARSALRPPHLASVLLALARGMSGFLGVYSCLSLWAWLRGGSYNANAWWIDMGRIPLLASGLWQASVTAALLAVAWRLPQHRLWRVAAGLAFTATALVAWLNAQDVYKVADAGRISLGMRLPFSLFVMIAYLVLAMTAWFGHRAAAGAAMGEGESATVRTGLSPRATLLVSGLAVAVSGLAFPLGQIACFGLTDYRAPVDAVVVLGARVYPNGTLSPALAGRVDKGIELFEQGLTPLLIMSGGTGVEGVNEAEAMRDYAVARGVPARCVIVDGQGSSTELTVANTVAIAERLGLRRIAAVSSYYHLPRIKMLFLEAGCDVLTVPSHGEREAASLWRSTLREVPAWWYYWLKYVAFA